MAVDSHAKNTSAGLGAGVVIGDPTGLTFKKWLENNKAVDAALAWGLGHDSRVVLHSTLLFHKWALFKLEQLPIDLYYGIGGRFRNINSDYKKDDIIEIGPRAPLGLRTQLKTVALEIFSEISVTLNLIESTNIDFDVGIGARYFF